MATKEEINIGNYCLNRERAICVIPHSETYWKIEFYSIRFQLIILNDLFYFVFFHRGILVSMNCESDI